jgi:osmotically-inducible protein OsmY
MSRLIPLVAVVLPLALGGCGITFVGGGVTGSGYAGGQERGVRGVIGDLNIKTRLNDAVAQANPPLRAELGVDVFQGRVLLTGRAQSPQDKQRARQIAAAIPGVRQVYDEIEVGLPPTAGALAQDAWISTQLRTELVREPDVRAINYLVATSDGSVYLIGAAKSQAELDRATQIARYVPDVKRVVSYVEIRPGAPMAGQPMPPPPASVAAPGAPSAVPTTPVEVQKL